MLSKLWVVEHEIRQRSDVPGRVETGEKGIKVVNFVGVPIAVPHDGPHKGIVQIPWDHLKATLLVLIQVVIVHIVSIVGVEVAHHRIHRKSPKNPVNVQFIPQILRVQIQGFNEVQQGFPSLVRFQGVTVLVGFNVGALVSQIGNTTLCSLPILITEHARTIAFEKHPIVFPKVLLAELLVDALGVHVKPDVLSLCVELHQINLRCRQIFPVNAARQVFLAVSRINPSIGQFELLVAHESLAGNPMVKVQIVRNLNIARFVWQTECGISFVPRAYTVHHHAVQLHGGRNAQGRVDEKGLDQGKEELFIHETDSLCPQQHWVVQAPLVVVKRLRAVQGNPLREDSAPTERQRQKGKQLRCCS